MDCNKDEAIKAKEIAENKMQNKDFYGARKIALKAQQLFPDLLNISQMLTVCEVHCSAEHKIFGSEMDWYRILQIEQTTDEASIKKQYRKLALILHPDKNKFAGAEAAFKLIGEAHRVLSDQVRRSIYDIKYKTFLGTTTTTLKQPQQQQNRNSFVDKISVKIGRTQFMGVNTQQQQQQTQPGLSNSRDTFWTACPFCSTRYQYYKKVLNIVLRCQNCMKCFTSYDLDAVVVPPKVNLNHFAIPQRNFPESREFRGNFGGGATTSEPFVGVGGTSEVGGVSSTKGDKNGNVNREDWVKGTKRPKFEAENGNDKAEECKESVEDSRERPDVSNEFKSNSRSKTRPDPEFFDVPDSDFCDFDKYRKEDCFEVDQMWAVYDNFDGMPRYYAWIKKVFSPGFKVRINWLEANPDGEDEIDWFSKDLPVSCGKFKHEKSEITEDLGMFSHLVSWEKGGRSSYMIYPRKGETWALFKNWDIKWSSDPDNHGNCEFEFVEALSDYVEGLGITVAYLVKLKGFVSLFRLKKGMTSFQIPPKDLFRFSHRVPSYRTIGTEREDVPQGYFELDPASLPDDLKEYADLEDLKEETESVDAKFEGSSKSQVERSDTLEKSINHDEKNIQDGTNSKCGNLSSRVSNVGHKKQSQANVAQCATSGSTHVKERQSDDMDPCEIPDPEFYSFVADKTPEKFQPGQIWALYCDLDGLPKYHAQINRIKLSPNFELHVTWLEPCPQPKNMIRWSDKGMPICCGTFKLSIGETSVFTDTSSFSHQSRAVPTRTKNKYEIYPRKGEVWALYKNFNSKWTCSDLDKCEYDVVEVLEDNGSMMKVLLLGLMNGFETVFEAQSKGGSPITIEIPRVELLKFSHKVPAFQLMEEREGRLKGCWELDPNSMPVRLFCLN